MAFDEGLAQRIREVIGERRGVVEKKMFGGIAFMLHGNMSVGVIGDDLVVRVDKADAGALLDLPHARPMDFTGKPMKGWIYVAAQEIEDDAEFAEWVKRGIAYAESLPAK